MAQKKSTLRKVIDIIFVFVFMAAIMYAVYYFMYERNVYRGKDEKMREIYKLLDAHKKFTFNEFLKKHSDLTVEKIAQCVSANINISIPILERIITVSLDNKVRRWFFLERRMNTIIKDGKEKHLIKALETKDENNFKKTLNILLYQPFYQVEDLLDKEVEK